MMRSRSVNDLGISAYLKMFGFKCIGRKGKNYYFEVSETENDSFDQLIVDYANSEFHRFDSELMSLKKLSEFLPNKS